MVRAFASCGRLVVIRLLGSHSPNSRSGSVLCTPPKRALLVLLFSPPSPRCFAQTACNVAFPSLAQYPHSSNRLRLLH